jgi:hypothetical protein
MSFKPRGLKIKSNPLKQASQDVVVRTAGNESTEKANPSRGEQLSGAGRKNNSDFRAFFPT